MARIEIHDDDTVDIHVSGKTETYSGEKLAHILEEAIKPGSYYSNGRIYTEETVERALDLYRLIRVMTTEDME